MAGRSSPGCVQIRFLQYYATVSLGCKDDNTCILKLADAAAIDFGYFYNDNSIRENREYASNIFRVRNAQGKIGYTYDVAISGGTKNITIK